MDFDKYYCKIDEWCKNPMQNFQDYENELRDMLEIATNFSWKELEAKEVVHEDIIQKYLTVISEALSYAGEPGEKGYSYGGIEIIKNNMGNVELEYLEHILKYNSYEKEKSFGNKLRPKVIRAMIENADLTENDSRKLKFCFFDSNLLGRMILRKYLAWLKQKYPDYRNADLDEEDKDEKYYFGKLENAEGEVLYLKVDCYNSPQFFLSITKEKDFNNMNYIEDCEVIFENKETQIYLREGKHEGKRIIIEFDRNNYDLNQYEKYDKEIDSLFTRERINEGKFELVYAYGEDIYDLPPISLQFNTTFDVKIETEIKGAIKVTYSDKRQNIPQDFWDKNISAVHALIGQNGSGKSSIFKLIFGCKLFVPIDEVEEKKYFIIYKYENEYYYTNTTGRPVETTDLSVEITEYTAQVDVNVCLISNVYELFSNYDGNKDKNSSEEFSEVERMKRKRCLPKSVIDLTTQAIMFDSKYRNETDRNLALKEDYCRIDNLKKFFGEDLKKFSIRPFDSVENLSSGEKTRVIIFARLLSIFYVDEDYKDKLPEIEKKNNYLILMDEAEVYMHPAWQKAFVNDLIRFIQKINKKMNETFRNITILLSSNSPFMMSDLPGSNIHILNGYMNTKTFGQNIYSILKDKFFMRDGVVGDFANTKIDRAFDLINSENVNNMTDKDKAYIKYIYDILGDVVMKEMLKRRMENVWD